MTILICGAGIAGLACAQQCQRLHIPYRIIEKQSQLPQSSAGIALPANAIAALRFMGLGPAIEKHAYRVSKIIYAKASGSVLSTASLLKPPLDLDYFMALERRQLHQILSAGLEQPVEYGTTITELTQEGDRVKVVFKNKQDPQFFAAVIGADGIHSTIRRHVFGKEALVDLDVTNWRWVCDYPTAELQPTYLIGSTDAFMVYPIAANRVYCYAHQLDRNQQLDERDSSVTHIKNIFQHYGGVVPELLSRLPQADSIITGRLRSMPRPLFKEGCVALVGDASSACSPMLQQGAASAFEDVIALTTYLHRYAVAEALDHYEKHRSERVEWIMQHSDFPLKTLVKMNSGVMQCLRNSLIRLGGPINVRGWKALFARNPLLELSDSDE